MTDTMTATELEAVLAYYETLITAAEAEYRAGRIGADECSGRIAEARRLIAVLIETETVDDDTEPKRNDILNQLHECDRIMQDANDDYVAGRIGITEFCRTRNASHGRMNILNRQFESLFQLV
jgi:hypothetical protein